MCRLAGAMHTTYAKLKINPTISKRKKLRATTAWKRSYNVLPVAPC